MKNKKIEILVAIFFLLSVISLFFLTRQINSQPTELSTKDSLKLGSIEKDVSLKKDTLNTDSLDLDRKKHLYGQDSSTNIIRYEIDSFEVQTSEIESLNRDLEGLYAQRTKLNEGKFLNIKTIILSILAFILMTAFIVFCILFSGILKLLKNNNIMTNNNTNPTEGQNNIDGNTQMSVAFGKVKPELSYTLDFNDKSIECAITIKCDIENAKIFYCFKSDINSVKEYKERLAVNKKCVILSKAIYNGTESEILQINVDPTKAIQIQDSVDLLETHQKKDRDVNTGTNVSIIQEANIASNAVIKDGLENNNDEDVKASEKTDKRIRIFTSKPNIIGISYQGDNHVKAASIVPCQDCHSFTKVNDTWSIAIVSDGAGSKVHSDIGSNAVCAAFGFYLTHMLKNDKRFINGDIPNEKIWDLEFRAMLNRFQSELKSHKAFNAYEFESLAATIIILVYSPKGYMFAHVGDGRAGVKVNGEWKTILTPHKGEEANQTVFSTTIEFANNPTLIMSGVFVPETKVELASIEAFVLMSDGCEDGAWATYQKVNLPDGDFRVEDINQPRTQTLEELMYIIDSRKDEQQERLVNFITGYNKGFKTEGDDKTILIGRGK